MEAPYPIPAQYPRGRYLLVFDPLDGSSNLDVNVTVGTHLLGAARARGRDRARGRRTSCSPARGRSAPATRSTARRRCSCSRWAAACTASRSTRRSASSSSRTRTCASPRTRSEFAINASNAALLGAAGAALRRGVPRRARAGRAAQDFNMRWIASLVAEVHRILVRGGLFMYPKDTKDPAKPGRLRLLYEANPMAMLVEQAGGARVDRPRPASSRSRRTALHQRVPVILGSRTRSSASSATTPSTTAGDDRRSRSPLFNERSLFGAARPDTSRSEARHVHQASRSSRSPARPAPAPPRSRAPSSTSSGARSINAAIVEGDSFHRYDRKEMKAKMAEAAAAGNQHFSHFGPEANLLAELEALFRTYGETGTGKRAQVPARRAARPRRTAGARHVHAVGGHPGGHRPAVLRGPARRGRHRRRQRRGATPTC